MDRGVDMITRQQLEQYTDYKREIAMLNEQICVADGIAVDRVRGSGSEAPYTLHGMTIEGYATRRDGRLRKRKAVLEERCAAIELFVEGLPNSLMRQLFAWRYLEGLSMADAARRVGYSERHAKRLIKNFFKMSPNVPKCP